MTYALIHRAAVVAHEILDSLWPRMDTAAQFEATLEQALNDYEAENEVLEGVHPVDSATRRCCGGIGAHTPECDACPASPADHPEAGAGHPLSAADLAEAAEVVGHCWCRLANYSTARRQQLLALAERLHTAAQI